MGLVKKNNCCCLLWLADHYHAGQLKAYCLKYVKATMRDIEYTQDVADLGDVLMKEVTG